MGRLSLGSGGAAARLGAARAEVARTRITPSDRAGRRIPSSYASGRNPRASRRTAAEVIMKKSILGMVLLGALALGAHAGQRYSAPVTIDLPNAVASGSPGSTRISADSVQRIGCKVSASPGVAPVVLCGATDAAGTTVECTSSDPGIVQVASALNGDSWLGFRWDKAHECTWVSVETNSQHEPKEP